MHTHYLHRHFHKGHAVWLLTLLYSPRSLHSSSTKDERLVMHETIGKMSTRISQLEGAIESLQSLVSTQPHPLLHGRDDHSMHPVVSTQPKKLNSTVEEEVLDALGAFSIGNKGETTFHEASAISEACYTPLPLISSDTPPVSYDSSFSTSNPPPRR